MKTYLKNTANGCALHKNQIIRMQHIESATKVYQTKDYDRFMMINGNRGINNKKIQKIIDEIGGGNNMLAYKPIEVSETNEFLFILDGQHRFYVSKKIKEPVYYIIVKEDKNMQEIAAINSLTEKWKMKDFINCYVNQGNENYIKLQEFIDRYPINIGTSLRLLIGGTPGTEGSSPDITDEFQKGRFEIKRWIEAVSLAESCLLFSACSFWRDRSFVIAIYRIRNAGLISIEELATAVNKNIDKLQKQVSQKLYIYNLEQIVNIGKQKRIVIT